MGKHDVAPVNFRHPERGLCVNVSEDGSRVLMTLDRHHAKELAKIIASLAVSRRGYDAWLELAHRTADDTWVGAMLGLIACAQNLHTDQAVPQQQR